ncbi:MAG TPA: 3-hydroxybutyryl-CoA dehydrogenase [Anaerolineales bacterium]|nr:3-hydroxybutyryl-CoA dehydrogenase [Anaerolineales bacterium]
MEIATIGILGAGQMGSGIAQVFAQHDQQVLLHDNSAPQLDKAIRNIQHNLEEQAGKGKLEVGSPQKVLARITIAGDLSVFKGCPLVIEAVSEDEALKLELFRRLDGIVRKDAILASNTSSISITRLGAATRRPDKVIGMHFMNPAPAIQLVEVVRGQATSQETFQAVAGWVEKLGKSMAVAQDYPGFILNRVLVPMLNEAIFALYEGVASAEDIDRGVQLGLRHPMGPLALADFIGLDTLLAICNVLYEGFKDPKYRPCPLLVRMVAAGQLGRKSGQGFYPY